MRSAGQADSWELRLGFCQRRMRPPSSGNLSLLSGLPTIGGGPPTVQVACFTQRLVLSVLVTAKIHLHSGVRPGVGQARDATTAWLSGNCLPRHGSLH